MSYFLHDAAFYSSQRKDDFPKMTVTYKKNSFSDFKSNRMTRKGQLIEQESILRRMKAQSLISKAHRENEIASMRIKYQLQELDLLRAKNYNQSKKISRQSQLIQENNMIKFAQIQGCRTSKKQRLTSQQHQFPHYIKSSRK